MLLLGAFRSQLRADSEFSPNLWKYENIVNERRYLKVVINLLRTD